MKGTILIVEDERKLARFLELELTHEGYAVDKAYDGREGLSRALSADFDLMLLDILLPELSGLEVLRRLRRDKPEMPVLLLTARDAVTDKVTGLDCGANDYMTKPFAIEELLARIRALLRSRHRAGKEVSVGALALYPESRTVAVNGEPVHLSRREFDLLHCLMENRGIVLSRDTLLNRVWDYTYDGGANTVDVYIRYLRAKLEEPRGLKLIETVRGVGYVIR
ncbi:MAG: response regulator transcription factor [Oscillospiraceae bacterium]|nr:response regulator transcription factor [Oscillospiraceae bacterium]